MRRRAGGSHQKIGHSLFWCSSRDKLLQFVYCLRANGSHWSLLNRYWISGIVLSIFHVSFGPWTTSGGWGYYQPIVTLRRKELARACTVRDACVHAHTHSCLTLCDPMDCSPPGSSVHGISQARILGVGCHFLLQGIFLLQGLNPGLLRLLHWQVDFLPLEPPGEPVRNEGMVLNNSRNGSYPKTLYQTVLHEPQCLWLILWTSDGLGTIFCPSKVLTSHTHLFWGCTALRLPVRFPSSLPKILGNSFLLTVVGRTHILPRVSEALDLQPPTPSHLGGNIITQRSPSKQGMSQSRRWGTHNCSWYPLILYNIKLIIFHFSGQKNFPFRFTFKLMHSGFPGSSMVKNLPTNSGDGGSIPGSGRSPGEGNDNPFQYSCLEIPWTEEPCGLQSMRLQKSQTWLSDKTPTVFFFAYFPSQKPAL